ncbi:hypothetical protein KFE25_001986 [Diacronema lutheri]|uniref:Uncharacterized protein n=2 Tax=Diacronema lutheri TaxID=2081491 RepID=A0A8J5XQW1_DIALT|nr:hypothetical protein KFE25_001986 [Diacronema lutheri]
MRTALVVAAACMMAVQAYAGGPAARPTGAARVLASATSSATRFTDLLSASQAAPRLTAVQRARTIGAGALNGVLSTLQEGGLPFAAPVDFVLNQRGEPVFLLKDGSILHANIAATPLSSLLIVDGTSGQAVSLAGEVGPLPEQEFAQSHVDFLNVHPVARECIAPGGLSFFKLAVQKCYLHAPDGGVWLPVAEYASATIDALAPFAHHIISSVNGPRRAELCRFCEAYFGRSVASAELVGIDELGFDVALALGAAGEGKGGSLERRRVGFSGPRKTEQEARSLFVKTFFQAWEPPAQPPSAS